MRRFISSKWDSHFLERSPMLAPLATCAGTLANCSEWPSHEVLQGIISGRGVRNQCGIPIRLVEPESNAGESYEERIYRHGELPVRSGDWHDLFNVLAWLAYPRAKAALNERHFTAALEERDCATGSAAVKVGANRGRVRDALTLFDESGAIIASRAPELIDNLRRFRWKQVFWKSREHVLEASRFYVFGHACFEKALDPYVGMTAHALFVIVSVDFLAGTLAQQIALLDPLVAARVRNSEELTTPRMLVPLPLLGIPGWWPANEQESFYDDVSYFRPERTSRAADDPQRR